MNTLTISLIAIYVIVFLILLFKGYKSINNKKLLMISVGNHFEAWGISLYWPILIVVYTFTLCVVKPIHKLMLKITGGE